MSKLLCVIPCRKSSKRFPDKNIKIFKGNPLLFRTINQAKQIFRKEQIIVNTDYDIDIDVNFYERPKHLRGDDITTEAVIKEMISYRPYCEMVVILQVTSPGRTIETIKKVIKYAYQIQMNAASGCVGPDGQVYVWFTNQIYGNWQYIECAYAVDIDTQLDFEVAEVLA